MPSRAIAADRINFGKIKEIIAPPNLIELQTNSYKEFLQAEIPQSKRILEINPEHPAVQALQKIAEKDSCDARVQTLGRLLYDQAVIAEGSRIQDPAGFARRVNELIARSTQ